MKIHYIMPMAGSGSRFAEQGYNIPKPLIEIYGKPFFYWSTQSIRKFIETESLNFVVLQNHIDNFGIDAEIVKYFPEAKIYPLKETTKGAVVTCMEGITDIEDSFPIVFNDCDHLFKSERFNMFCGTEFDRLVDGALLTFLSSEGKFSFVGKDGHGNVTVTAEKKVISNEAVCGCYYFRSRELFVDAAEEYLAGCPYDEYYMSGVYNVMIKKKMTVKCFRTDFHVPFGTPEEYERAKCDHRYEELI